MVRTINKVVKNFLSISFANISSQILTFLVVAYYARILGSSIFGTISTVQSIIVYFTMFVMLGLQTYGTREVSKTEGNIYIIVGNVVLLRTIAFFIGYLVLIIVTLINKNNSVFNQLLLLYGITLLPSALNLDWVFSGLQEMQYNAVYNVIKNLVPCILIFIFLKDKEQFYYIPIFTAIGLAGALVYQAYVFFIKNKFKISLKFSGKNFKKYIVYGYPFMISGMLAMINSNVDRLVINFTRGSGEAGVYAAGYNIIMFLTNIITLLFTPIFPLLIKYYHTKEHDKLKKLIDNITRIAALIALPIFAGGALLSKDIILLLFGQEYIRAYLPFAILMAYILILFFREIYGYCLNSWNLEGTYLKIVFTSSMVNLVLNLIFTPIYGMNIAASITIISEVINLTLMRRSVNRVLSFKVLRNFVKMIIPTLVMSIAIILIKYVELHLFINIFIAIMVYFVVVIKLNVISIGEIKMVLFKKEGSL